MKQTWIKALASALLGAACAVAQAGAIATDATPGCFDADSGARILHIGEHGIVGNLTLGIDFAKCNDPGVGADGRCIDNTGSFDNEIYFRLSSPNGSLEFNNGNVTPGSVRPVEALAGLGGGDMFGDWTLLVGDAGYGDPLQYFGAVVAEPGMVAVMVVGVLAMGAALKSRQERYGLGSPPSRGRRS